MAGENVPSRPIALNALLYVLPVTTQLAASVLTPTAAATLANGANLFGPIRDISIRDPVGEIDQTAGGDVGNMVIHGRPGVWELTIGAMMDVSTSPKAVGGDSRLQILLRKYVEFLIIRDTGVYVVQGFGRFLFESYDMPAAASESILRNVRIARWLPTAVGNLQWARGTDGTFVTESATVA